MLTFRLFRLAQRHPTCTTVIATLAIAGVAVLIGAAGVIRAGWYDVSALDQHWQASFTTMQLALRYSVRHHARDVTAPPLTPALVMRGAQVYRTQCVQCHGAPGVAPDNIGLSLQPLPGPLVHMTQRWTSEEIYWMISSGIKMSGMPAWRYRLSENDLWAVTALVTRLPVLSPQDYAALQASSEAVSGTSPAVAESAHVVPSPQRGKRAIPQYACQSCHQIPGIVGGKVRVGPPLDHYTAREYVAGYLPNTPANLAWWLRATHQVKPLSAMPDLGVSAQDAADIAAYLRDQSL